MQWRRPAITRLCRSFSNGDNFTIAQVETQSSLGLDQHNLGEVSAPMDQLFLPASTRAEIQFAISHPKTEAR